MTEQDNLSSKNSRLGSIKGVLSEEPEEHSLGDSLAHIIRKPSDLMEHISALRKHLTRSLIVLVIAASISFFFVEEILGFLSEPIGGVIKLQAIDVTEPISVVMRTSLLTGFVLSVPYITLELWFFIVPGIKVSARKLGFIAIPLAIIFFASGLLFAYFILLPTAVPFLVNFLDFETAIRPSSYIRFTTGILFWMGISFEFPLVIFFLSLFGLIQPKTLIKNWRIAIVVIAVLAAVITPTVDPINMGIVMAPLTLLYILSIGLAHIGYRKNKSEE